MHSASNTTPKAAVVPPDTSTAHAASAPQTPARQDVAAANAAHMMSRGVSVPYPTVAPQSPSTAQQATFAAKSHGAASSSSAAKPALTAPAPHATVHRQLDASGISSDNDTAPRLATSTGTGVAAPHATAAMLSSPATASVHSVAQPTVVGGQYHHYYQQELQAPPQQTAANTVDLALYQSSHKPTVNGVTTPASHYGGQQSWTQQSVTSSSGSGTGSAQFSGARRNAMVCSDEVIASIQAVSLAAKVSRLYIAQSIGVHVSCWLR
jgi:hypothetical protein